MATSEVKPSTARQYAQTGLYVKGSNGHKLRDNRVRYLVFRMRQVMPWLADSDIPTARVWAQLEVIAANVYAELRDDGVVSKQDGDARRLLNDFRQLRATQLLYARELGMTPVARQALSGPSAKPTLDLEAFRQAADDAEGEFSSAEPVEDAGPAKIPVHDQKRRRRRFCAFAGPS
jgi:hypothetical protein